jgi:hypothetical protein
MIFRSSWHFDLPVSIPSAPALQASMKDALVFSAARVKGVRRLRNKNSNVDERMGYRMKGRERQLYYLM